MANTYCPNDSKSGTYIRTTTNKSHIKPVFCEKKNGFSHCRIAIICLRDWNIHNIKCSRTQGICTICNEIVFTTIPIYILFSRKFNKLIKYQIVIDIFLPRHKWISSLIRSTISKSFSHPLLSSAVNGDNCHDTA